MSSKHTRPWYVSEKACDEYRTTLTKTDDRGGDLEMLKSLKILRSIIVNVGIIAIALYSIRLGGSPNAIGFLALAVLGGYNGLEVSDYFALVQAYQEVQGDDGDE